MNIRKLIPLLLLASSTAVCSFYACSTSKSPSGTPGSPRDTTGAQATKPGTIINPKALTSGTPGSPRDTTGTKKN
ncbi:MAG: hypothetical protein J0H74_07610 [Chitinophagaceae bacterium]|nr:hypothetical protein [Chitinophagaceae bacterium]